MRMDADRASARSFWRAVTLRTGTPRAGCSSYWVTEGPELTPITVASTSKLSSVCSISRMVFLISSCSRSLRTVTVSSRLRSGLIQGRCTSSSARTAGGASPISARSWSATEAGRWVPVEPAGSAR